MVVQIASFIFSILIGIVILFQLALALGMPWGECAMGGKFPGKLPPPMRFAAVIQMFVLGFIGSIVLSKAGLWLPEWSDFSGTAVWFVIAFCTLSTFLNIITTSVWERRIWAPVAMLLLVTSLIVAVS